MPLLAPRAAGGFKTSSEQVGYVEFASAATTASGFGLGAADAIRAMLLCPDGEADGKLAFGAPVVGRTRLMKELFLVAMETEAGKAGALGFPFTPGPYGPSSFDVQHELERLTYDGEVIQEPLPGSDGSRLLLGPDGYTAARKIWTLLPPDIAQSFYSIKSKFNSVPYGALLFYVYSAYPAFTTRSRNPTGRSSEPPE